MNQLAESILETGGEIVGVTVQALKDKEEFHKGLTRLDVVPTMHERKTLMIDLSDGSVDHCKGAFAVGWRRGLEPVEFYLFFVL
jgi:hypothetical protein